MGQQEMIFCLRQVSSIVYADSYATSRKTLKSVPIKLNVPTNKLSLHVFGSYKLKLAHNSTKWQIAQIRVIVGGGNLVTQMSNNYPSDRRCTVEHTWHFQMVITVMSNYDKIDWENNILHCLESTAKYWQLVTKFFNQFPKIIK